ncbi:PAS/PAC sensor hybrid histidine kinase [Catenovulum agarivorans DS-2]|uniref:histidine kinase n=1 Tax=Catenovulum agarivorans DS-2 TaxID=1328313 RepID=W7QDN4_9ALTE|nr:PAS domain S-box protein [Catenovulum agarivorans]EWH10026.1 PAS/PAC sensor hybrid histidine kinase [Catenovulum agarivorans DS-2]
MNKAGRWFFASFVVGATGLLVLAFIIQSHLVQYFQAEKQQNLTAQVELAYSQVQELINLELAELSVWTEHPLVVEFAKQQLEVSDQQTTVPSLREMDYLALLIENGVLSDVNYHNTYIFSPSGQQVWQAETTISPIQIPTSHQDYWLEQLHQGRPVALFLTEKAVPDLFFPILFAVPVVEQSKVIAILALELNHASRMSTILDAARMSGQGRVYLFSRAGDILLSDKQGDSVLEDGYQISATTHTDTNKQFSSVATSTQQTQNFLYAQGWVKARDFGILLSLPREIVDQALKKIQVGILILVFFAFIVMLVLIFVVNVSREKLRKKQDSVLRHQQRLLHVQDLAHVACIELDSKTNQIDWYSGFEFIAELLSVDSVKPKVLFRQLHPSQRGLILGQIDKVQREQTNAECEVHFKDKLSDTKFFLAKFYLKENPGSYPSVLILITDITEQKLKQKEALQAEIEYRDLILQSAHDGIVSVDVSGQISLSNAASEIMLGYSRRELQHKRLYQFIDKPSGLSMSGSSPCTLACEQQQPIVGTYWFRRKDGSSFPADCRVNPIIRNDEAVGAVYLFRDISEQLKFESELKEREQRFRRVIEGTSDATFDWNMLDNKLHWNARYWEILDYPYAQAQKLADSAHFWHETVFPDDLDNLITSIQAHLVHNKNFDCEFRACKKTGGTIWLRARGQAIREQGKFIYMSGTISDISNIKSAEQEKRVLEEQLRHSQKMEAIGQLTGGIAHDFNNILASVLGYAELIQDCIELEQTNKLPDYVEQIMTSGERARDLIRQMMVFSRNDTQTTEAISLNKVLKDTLAMVRPLLPSSIDTQVNIDADCRVLANPIQLQQIIMNLAINARDAMSERGFIIVETEFMTSGVRVCSSCHNSFEGLMVCIRVEDNGNGIDEDTLKRIFDPYFTTKGLGEGSGMGLSIVHGIIHQLGGHILVDSQVGKGTKFEIYLPIVYQPEKEQGPQTTAAIENKLLTNNICIVDDESAIASYLAEKLSMHGFNCHVYTDSRRALQALSKDIDQCDLLITDQTMPQVNGIELANQLKQIKSDLAVILMTGYSEQVNDKNIQQFDVDGFIAKPIDSKQLLNLVSQTLQSKQIK